MRDCVNTFHDRTDCPKPRLLESEDRCTNLANDAQAIMGIAHRLYNRHINMIKHTGRTDCKFLRAYLILEEVAEAMLALADNDETSLLDALADLLYVTYGTAVVYDLPLGAGFAAVHLSNMTKNTCRGAKNNTDGDRGKNEGYREPCLPRLLQDYRTGNDEVNLDVKPYPAVEYPRSSQQLLLWEALTTAKTEVEQRRIEDHEPNGT